jgi:hypothetical protein
MLENFNSHPPNHLFNRVKGLAISTCIHILLGGGLRLIQASSIKPAFEDAWR